MIPTLIALGLVLMAVLPAQKRWFLGVVAVGAVTWATYVAVALDNAVDVVALALVLAAVNVAVGGAVGLGVRALVTRLAARSRHNVPSRR